MAKLEDLTGAKTPEEAFNRLVDAAQSTGQQDIGLLLAARRSIGDQQWREVASTLISNLGRPAAEAIDPLSAGQFVPANFIVNYGKLTAKAKDVLFRSSGNGKLADELDSLFRVSGALKKIDGLRSISDVKAGEKMLSSIGKGILKLPNSLIGGLVSSGTGRLLMSPRFIRHLTRFVKASASRRLQSTKQEALFLQSLNRLQQSLPVSSALRADVTALASELAGGVSQTIDSMLNESP